MSAASLRIPLPDLDCAACAERVALRLRRLDFVRQAHASATEGVALVRVTEAADLVRLVETIRQAGSEPATIEVSIPVASIATSLEQALSLERELAATEGVLRAEVDLDAGEVLAVLVPGRADVDRVRRVLHSRGWSAAHPGAGAAAPPDRSQIDAARRAAFRAATVLAAAFVATLLCARVGPRAVAPLFSIAGDFRERVSAWTALPAGVAHGLLGIVAFAAILAGGAPLLRGAARDLVHGVATTRLLSSAALGLLLLTSLAASMAGALFGSSTPLFYASAVWSLAVVLVGALLSERALLTRRRSALAEDAIQEPADRARLFRLRARSAFAQGKSTRRGRLEAVWWGAVTAAAAVLTATLWLAADRDRWPEAALAAASVLLAAAPGAFALVAPLASARTIRDLQEKGIAVSGARALETAARVEVLFATLRGGVAHPELRVSDFVLLEGIPPSELLELAAAVGSPADPRIRAIADRLARESGARKRRDPEGVRVGSSEQLRQHQVDLSAIETEIAEFERALKTVVVVAKDGRPAGAIALESELRPGGTDAVRRLKALGCETWIATEDTDETAAASKSAIGASRYASGLDREGKARLVARTREEGRRTAFLGSPSDSLAARRADFSLSFRDSGHDATFEDALLLRNDSAAAAELFEMARESERRVRSARRALIGYHLLALPLAGGVLAPLTGYAPAPFLAALASLVVMTAVQFRRKP